MDDPATRSTVYQIAVQLMRWQLIIPCLLSTAI